MQPVTRPKDYIVTEENLYFAVVLHMPEYGHIIASLRYLKNNNGVHKFTTSEAFEIIKNHYPDYLFSSIYLDCETIAVPRSRILRVVKPEETIIRLLGQSHDDVLLKKARDIIKIFAGNGIDINVMGITGSVMLGFHGPGSDIDMVIYERDAFHAARSLVRRAIENNSFSKLDKASWLETYKRRNCSLSPEEYYFHEQRKFNKFMYKDTKVDITFLPFDTENYSPCAPVKKTGISTIRATISDDRYIFDYPARYITDHYEISEILVFTATYYGQAFKGETVEATGVIECDADNKKYMIIGTSREATGETLRVIR